MIAPEHRARAVELVPLTDRGRELLDDLEQFNCALNGQHRAEMAPGGSRQTRRSPLHKRESGRGARCCGACAGRLSFLAGIVDL
jgi:hypothetical protein